MEFPNRNVQSQTAAPGAPGATGTSGVSKRNKADGNKWGRIGLVAAVAAVVILLIAVTALVGASNTGGNESQYVDNNKLQAVFLNTGQVYFGSIKKLNSRFFVVSNIYYLQTSGGGNGGSTSNSNTSVSLVKLGCELHEPYDQMVINRSQVTFWENLQDNGQVAKAVATFQKQNPTGQKCADQSSSSSNTSNSAQPAGNNNDTNSTTPSKTPAIKP